MDVDLVHRSYLSTVTYTKLEVLCLRTSHDLLQLDHRWFDRLRAAGLLPLYRLLDPVEGDNIAGTRHPLVVDKSLLTVRIDTWSSETHTFHLLCGEMAPMLQDIAFLLGLPVRDEAVGPQLVGPHWLDDPYGRFAQVAR